AAPPTVNDSGALLALAGVLPGPTSALTASAGTCTWPAAVGLLQTQRGASLRLRACGQARRHAQRRRVLG
ncbi:hypothetical protein, partial [Bordetella pertussis]|uniref:hypothetical protein n=1 Tax=Bordetella pertussis TaxID=520 RepID=UPI000AEA1723